MTSYAVRRTVQASPGRVQSLLGDGASYPLAAAPEATDRHP
jgi:hypothetical protein